MKIPRITSLNDLVALDKFKRDLDSYIADYGQFDPIEASEIHIGNLVGESLTTSQLLLVSVIFAAGANNTYLEARQNLERVKASLGSKYRGELESENRKMPTIAQVDSKVCLDEEYIGALDLYNKAVMYREVAEAVPATLKIKSNLVMQLLGKADAETISKKQQEIEQKQN